MFCWAGVFDEKMERKNMYPDRQLRGQLHNSRRVDEQRADLSIRRNLPGLGSMHLECSSLHCGYLDKSYLHGRLIMLDVRRLTRLTREIIKNKI